jgi:hypothetical protein
MNEEMDPSLLRYENLEFQTQRQIVIFLLLMTMAIHYICLAIVKLRNKGNRERFFLLEKIIPLYGIGCLLTVQIIGTS